jgi:hypothetical protein
LHTLVVCTTGDSGAGTVSIFKPKQGAKQFDPLALITFKTTTLKYQFEREFAIWKRTNPTKHEKLTISRAPPTKIPGEDLNEKPMDIRRQIAGYDKHFSKDIPNKDTRKEAQTNPAYRVYYELKTYKK